MEKKEWITTEQMLEALKNDANYEHEYNLWLCNAFLPILLGNVCDFTPNRILKSC